MSQQADKATIEEEINLVLKLTNSNDRSKIEFNDLGWTSRVYLFNRGEFVFKFPRYEEVKKEYKWEIEAYKLVTKIDTPILSPEVRWEDPDFSFIGYKGIQGSPLDETLDNLSDITKQKIGMELGVFLKKLHALNLPGAPTMTGEDEHRDYIEKFTVGEELIRSKFSAQEFNIIKNFVHSAFIKRALNLESTITLCHGDLGFWNMIVGENNVLGIIDFGNIHHCDRSKDFAGMCDEVVLESALEEYGSSVNLRAQIDLRMSMMPILDIPFFAGKGDEEGIERTIQSIRSFLSYYS